MTVEMKKYKLGDIAKIYDGPHATPKKIDQGPIYLGINAVTEDCRIDPNGLAFLSEEDYKVWTKRVTPQHKDIVFSYEATLGRYAIIPENFYGCLGRRLGIVRVVDAKVNYEWLFYYFQSPQWKSFIKNHTIKGSTVDRISVEEMPNYEIPAIDINKQNRIALVLSTLDKRIENLRAQNRVLEQTAKTIYDYTFLQCAGHQTTYNKTLNRNIPTNWDVKKMEEVLLPIERGISYSSEEIKSGKGMPMYNLACFDKQGNYRSGELKFYSGEYKKSDLIKLGDMLIACTDLTRNADIIGTPVIVNDEYDSFVFTTDLAKITPKNEDMKYHIYFWLKNSSYRKYIKPFASGTNVLHLNVRGVLDYPILVPDSSVLKKFNAQVEPVFKKQLVNSKQIKALTTQRNTLLPLLMTGQIEVVL